MSELLYVMKEENIDQKTNMYGVFRLEKDALGKPAVISHFEQKPSLDTLAEEVANRFHYRCLPAFTFNKRDGFPDFYVTVVRNILVYSELIPEERERFLTYLQRAFKGEPAKKRHNPE